MADKSISRINAEHELAKRRETGQRRGTRKYRQSEVRKADATIEDKVREAEAKRAEAHEREDGKEFEGTQEAPKSTRKPRAPKTYTFTAEELRQAREDGTGRSWADVAKLLGLPNPGAARKAWSELMGQPHTQAKQLVSRARKGASASSRLAVPQWDDLTDRQAIVDTLTGAQITVKASLYGGNSTETLNVAKVIKFDDSDPEDPAVEILEGVRRRDPKTHEDVLDMKVSTGATRTIRLSRIIEVR